MHKPAIRFDTNCAKQSKSPAVRRRAVPLLICLALVAFWLTPRSALGQVPSTLLVRSQEPETQPPETTEQPPSESEADPESPPPEQAQPDDNQPDPEAADEPQPAEQSPRDPRNVADLEAFVDGILNVQLKNKHIAGATLVIVADGEVLLAKGYGYADVEERKPVDPERTMFRIGSVSKLLTWTAVMQLVEQGKLDLDTDVNDYLTDLQVPVVADYEPIALKHLMTHTPGFDDHVIGLFARSADKMRPLEELLADEMPNRVRQPGDLASYSNHGAALAGYIVQEVSGMPWADYIEQHILEPLEMRYTTVRQPPEEELPEELSKGYKRAGGRFEQQGFEYVPVAPAGAVSASAVDMAKFMIAHLNDGRYGSAQILKEETARRMHGEMDAWVFQHHPKVDAMVYGFWELNRNGQRILQHGGDTFLFHSLWAIIPEQNVGLFVSYNTDTGASGRGELLNAFLDRYYPVPEPPRPEPLEGFKERVARVEGSYAAIRHSHTSIAKLARIMGVATVTASDDGTLTIGGRGEYVEVEPLVFNSVDGKETIAFQKGPGDRITHMFISSVPAIAFERVSWYETQRFQLGLLAGCVAVLFSALVGWPVAAFITRGCEVPGGPRTAVSALVSWLGWLTAVAATVYLVGFTVVMSDANQIAFGISPFLERLQIIPLVIAGLTVGVLFGTLVAWRNGYWRLTGRLHYTLVLFSSLGLIWMMVHWNLLQLPLP